MGYNSSGRSVSGGRQLCKVDRELRSLLQADDAHWPPVIHSPRHTGSVSVNFKEECRSCRSVVSDCNIGLHVQSSYNIILPILNWLTGLFGHD